VWNIVITDDSSQCPRSPKKRRQPKPELTSEKGKGEGKDSVTGLSLEYGPWGIVASDKVYTPSSKLIKKLDQTPDSELSI